MAKHLPVSYVRCIIRTCTIGKLVDTSEREDLYEVACISEMVWWEWLENKGRCYGLTEHLHIQLSYYWSVHTHISIPCMCKLYTPNAWFCLVIMTTLFLPSWSPQSQSCPLVTSALGKIPFASIVLAPSRGDTRDLKDGRHTQLQLRKLHTTLYGQS